MAKRFLTHIDLAGNQILNAAFEKLTTDPTTGNFEGRIYYNTADAVLKVYDGTDWIPVGAIVDVEGTTNEIEVSVVDGVATVGLPSNIHVDVTGNLTGNADTATHASTADNATNAQNATNADYAATAGSAQTAVTADYATEAGMAYTVQPDSVVLGTSTIGDYVATVDGSDGVSVTGGAGEGTNINISNTDKGSSQNIFKNFEVLGVGTISADNNNDTVLLVPGDGVSIVTGTQGDDSIEFANTGVLSVQGTTNEIDVDVTTGDVTISLPDAVIFPGTVTLNADPQQALEAATKQYVDTVAEGLNVHAAVQVATTTSVDLNSPPSSIDGVTLTDQMRVLVKDQGVSASQNGIYVYDLATDTLVRASDYDAASEIDPGDFFFVTQGSTYASSGWVQIATVSTLGSDPINFTQFSGAGTYLAGNGLELLGSVFSIDTAVTVDVSTAQTLTNKTLTSPVVSGLYLSDNNIVIEGTDDTHETTLVFTDPTEDRTITFKNESGTVAFTSDIASAIDALTTSDIEEGANLYYTDERAQDAVGDIVTGSNSISVSYNDGTPSIAFDTTLASTSYLSKSGGLAVDISALETKLVTDSFTKKATANIGNGTNTSFAVEHNLGTRDVQVQVYDNATYDTVEVDVVRTDTNTVTVSFSAAPASNAYRVVVIG